MIFKEFYCSECGNEYGTGGKNSHQCYQRRVKDNTYFGPEAEKFVDITGSFTKHIQDKIADAFERGFKIGKSVGRAEKELEDD